MTKKIYFENLDGLRFLCFLSVFMYHSFHTEFDYIRTSEIYHFLKRDLFGNGNLGVNFFFVLSGFLITYLLIEEKRLNGQLDVKHFWIRRALRIWPLFYLCVAFGFFVFPYLSAKFGHQANENASIGYYLTFTNNFDFINSGPPDASILGVLWSVAIEEQFYFVWPLILYVLPINKYWIAFTSAIIGSLIFRFFHVDYLTLEIHTLSCIGDMAVGALGAWLILSNDNFKRKIQNLNPAFIALIYTLFLAVYLFRDELMSANIFLLNAMERLLIAVIMLSIVLEQCFSEKSLFKMSRFQTFSKLGKISYGLYCLHFLGILIATTITDKCSMNHELWQVLLIDTLLAFSFTVFLSLMSYRFYEKPFLRLKEKFSYIKTS